MKCALTIAGSDSGGGAGIQADLKTFAALEVHGLSAIAALTAQSTVGVRGIHEVPAEFVKLQMETVLDDFDVAAAKTGMLFSSAIIRAVAEVIEARNLPTVVDPVMVAESGAVLLPESTVPVLADILLPRAVVVTPNLPEAALLTGIHAESEDEMVDAGRALIGRGARAVLMKGGHRRGAPVDLLIERTGEVTAFRSERIATTSTHGTGCTYAAAIAAYLARGETLRSAIERAHRFLFEAICAAPRTPALGRGKGPVHHFHRFYTWS